MRFLTKKCRDSYELKKDWLRREFDNGYVFRRIDARAKVFIEYGPAEKAWIPIDAPNYLLINCFWVSGQYKGQGYGKELLRLAIEDAKAQGKDGLVTVVGTSKFHFMSDTKWLLKQGFETCEKLSSGFSLLVKKTNPKANSLNSKNRLKVENVLIKNGLVVYFFKSLPILRISCDDSLTETAEKRKLPLKVIKLDTMEKAQTAPTPATIFSLFYNGKFITTDLSSCMNSKFDKVVKIKQ